MRNSGSASPYEVYCHQCNVTAPVGTRRCVHCGGRISRSNDPQRAALSALLGTEIIEADEEIESEEEEAPQSLASVAAKIALWVAILIGGLVYRLCE